MTATISNVCTLPTLQMEQVNKACDVRALFKVNALPHYILLTISGIHLIAMTESWNTMGHSAAELGMVGTGFCWLTQSTTSSLEEADNFLFDYNFNWRENRLQLTFDIRAMKDDDRQLLEMALINPELKIDIVPYTHERAKAIRVNRFGKEW